MMRIDNNADISTAQVLAVIGESIRSLRAARGLTLGELAARTRLSASMLSLVERGKASPSVGTLVAISSVFGVQIPELLGRPKQDQDLVTPLAKQTEVETADGVIHRMLTNDQARGVEITFNRYRRGTSNSPKPIIHDGFEYGVVLDGSLEVEVSGKVHRLSEGDLISYPSNQPHRITNKDSKGARALWITVRNR
jgi:transcriptional regulator with XRE-family HTH domain